MSAPRDTLRAEIEKLAKRLYNEGGRCSEASGFQHAQLDIANRLRSILSRTEESGDDIDAEALRRIMDSVVAGVDI